MEKWDLLDGDGRPLGQTLVRGTSSGQGNIIWWSTSGWRIPKGRLLIQKRAPHLKLMPDTWAVTGGSALAGEDSLTARARAVGGAGDRGRPFRTQTARPPAPPQLFVRSLAAPADVPLSALRLQKEEVADARWVSRVQLIEMVKRRRFHHYGSPYFDFLFRSLDGEPDILPVK